MTKNITIENYISYQKSTDKSPATLTSYRSDLIQFAIWGLGKHFTEFAGLNLTL